MKDLTAADRKKRPVATGCIDYFPDALEEVALLSFTANEQHNPGTPVHWDRSKSTDEADALMRHFIDRGKRDSDGMRHSAKVAWRALALLQKEIEAEAAELKSSPVPPESCSGPLPHGAPICDCAYCRRQPDQERRCPAE